MNAQPQPQDAPPARQTRAQRHSTETRLAILETRWEDVIPTLATKSDILRAEAKAANDTAEVKVAVTQLETKLETSIAIIKKDMEAMMNKIIIRVSSIAVAAIIATGTLVALIQKIGN